MITFYGDNDDVLGKCDLPPNGLKSLRVNDLGQIWINNAKNANTLRSADKVRRIDTRCATLERSHDNRYMAASRKVAVLRIVCGCSCYA
jgi:hypothetical protein